MLRHPAPLRILLVEDNPGDERLIREMLNEAGSLATELTHVGGLAAARARCAECDIDVVLLDLSLPDGTGLDTVREALTFAATAPIIVLTGLDDEEVAVQAVHAGAQDYLVKGRLDATLLARAIRYARERHELERERQCLLEREQQARTEAEAAVRARDDILRVVSHDIGNILAAINIHAHLLNAYLRAADVSDPGVTRATTHGPMADGARVAVHRVEAVRELVAQMDRLRQDLLDMASLDAGRLSIEPQRHQVRPILTGALQVVEEPAAEKALHLDVEIDGAVPDVRVDPDRIQQVLLNLLGNAVKFSPERGRIVLHATAERDMVRVSVIDNGPGIAAEHLPHVFERFWKLHDNNAAGTGLGLAIARGIIEAHGGSIGIDSEPGRGTAVSFTLKAAD